MNFRWPQCVPNNLKTLIPNASPDAIHLMTKLLQWDPRKRPASAQALRYSYFHVGQALGTPQQILEQGRPQLGLVHLQTPLQMQQQQPLLLKPVPPSQPPPSNQHCSSSRPLHQIQTSPAPAAAQAAAYQQHTEMVRKQQQPNHILKQEQTEGTSQRRLPYIVDKGHQEKQTQQDVHNLSLLGYQLKPKGGRRRWGHAAGHVKGEDWDNYEETDPSSISILGKPNFSSEKSRQGDDSLSRFGTVLDFSRRSGQEDAPLNLNKTAAYQEPSRTASAKQHYLRQSRYLPGISTKKNVAMNASKEFPGSHFCGSSSIAFGGTLPSRGAHGTNTIPGDYMPSFYKKDNGSVGHSRGRQGVSMETNYATWRSGRSHMNPSASVSTANKSSSSLLPLTPQQTIHGRTDWPLHQIQTSPAPAAAQAAAYQQHTEMVREQQQPKHILKQEQTEGTSQRRLPYIVDKSHQEKQTQQDVHNLSLLGYQLKPKGGRRRWGHAAGHVKGEDWDNYEETDPSSISILGKPNFSSEKSRQGDDSLSRFGTVLDFSRRSGKEDAPLNLNRTAAYQEPSRTASAKQHYLRQSRYLPGISTKKNVAMNASKEFPGSHFCGSSSIAFGGTLPSRGAHGTNTIPGDYMPSFYKKDNGSVGHSRGRQGVSMETNYATWRSGHMNPSAGVSTANKSSSSLLPRTLLQTIQRRPDWTAKYGHR
ncbi:serine/threonine-protein kinase ICK-like [Nothobranchius furzeri]|uniref:serine/threonine-protein kinase ICK-like n=1 Tax=Nothobranchius furzeri TaxID=105023 RepID=UPI0039049870